MEKPSPETGRAGSPVPCPRCQSSNTKFCYYNNHNVNQPRHFCRDCQRYWTAGGSLRNVPIGAGKRKHKIPHTVPTKPENLPNIFSFPLDQGVYTPTLEHANVLSFKQHVTHSYGESKQSETQFGLPQTSVVVVESKPQVKPVHVARSQAPVSYDAANAVAQSSAFICPLGPEKVRFGVLQKQPSLSLGLKLPKEAGSQENDANMGLHVNNNLLDPASSRHQASKQDCRFTQSTVERDESPGCSSVTANLGPSVSDTLEVSTNSAVNAQTMAAAEQSSALLNPMVAWGASMCPPWVWPFILSGRSVVPPSNLSQVDPTLAAATIGAMASMPPINPAFAAAMGAIAAGGRSPQIDSNVMTAITASFLQFPNLWPPYTWGFPWGTAWNMSNAVGNPLRGGNKRPVSPSSDDFGASKSAKREQQQEASHCTGMQFAESGIAPNFLYPAGYLDALRAKPDPSSLKPPVLPQLDEHLETHQQQASPHSNPAAQARSAAFQEGN